jgi:cytoskeletal protein RodZ
MMTIGQQLRRAREERALSIEQVSQETHIRVQYLSAIEAENFDVLPSPVQTRGFIRAYAACLRLDSAPLLAILDGVKPGVETTPVLIQAPNPENGSAAGEPRVIFSEIGQTLQHQREILGLSIDDVERYTHIRAHYIQALEIGNLEGLPSPVQGRGMLKNYAHFLGLDYDQLIACFADGLRHA